MNPRGPIEVDDGFLQQVYRWSTILALLGTAVLWGIYGFPTGLSFAIGSLFSLGAVLALELVVRRMVVPGSSPKAKRWLGFIAIGKFTVIFGGFYFLMKANWLNIYTLAAGVGLVQVVIILKAFGLMAGILFRGGATKR